MSSIRDEIAAEFPDFEHGYRDDEVYCNNCKKIISRAEAQLYMGHCQMCGSLGIWDLLF